MKSKEPLVLTRNIITQMDLLKRNIAVLKTLMQNESTGIQKLAELTGFSNGKVRYSLRILERKGLIKPTYYGAVTTSLAKNALTYLKGDLKGLNIKIDKVIELLE